MTADRLEIESRYLTELGRLMDLEPKHDEVVIEPDDEHAQSDLRERVRDAERRQP